jgi:hypothetical protein
VLVDRLLPRALLRPIVLVDLLPKVTLITISKNKADHVRGGGSYAGAAGSNSSSKRPPIKARWGLAFWARQGSQEGPKATAKGTYELLNLSFVQVVVFVTKRPTPVTSGSL